MAKILLTDESVTIRKVVELVLSEEGFQVESVSTGDEALASVEKEAPALILADVKAKGKNGYEIAQAVKGNPSTANIPVILLAGAFEPINEDLLSKSGAEGSLVKPFESKDLIEKIKSLVAAPAEASGAEDDIVFDMSGDAAEETADVLEAAPAEDDTFDMEEPGIVELDEAEATEALEAVEAEAAGTVEAVEAVEAEEDLWDLGDMETGGEAAEAVEAVETLEETGEVAEPEPVSVEEPSIEPEPQPVPAAPAEALSAEAVATALPGREEMSEIFRELAAERLDAVMETIDLKALIAEALEPTIRESLTNVLEKTTPEITEKLLKEAVQENLSTLNEKLESVIWETVPELAESIIKKEIEKIKSEI